MLMMMMAPALKKKTKFSLHPPLMILATIVTSVVALASSAYVVAEALPLPPLSAPFECTTDEQCELLLAKGSTCDNKKINEDDDDYYGVATGYCTNPYTNGGCLYNKLSNDTNNISHFGYPKHLLSIVANQSPFPPPRNLLQCPLQGVSSLVGATCADLSISPNPLQAPG